MKFLFDYIPILCFFMAYLFYGIYVATAATMIASVLQVAYFWMRHRRFERLHLITLILIVILGSATLLLHNPIFIKWKPSIVYWLFATALLISHYAGKNNLLHHMLSNKIKVPGRVWTQLNFAWAAFFAVMGFLNLYVIYHYSTDTWVYFKLFGTMGLMLLFIIGQALYMAKHMENE